MRKVLDMTRKPQYWLALLAMLNMLAGFYYIKTPFMQSGDTSSYLNAIDFLKGSNLETIPYNRILTVPLTLYSSMLIGSAAGSDAAGLLVLNIVFYLLIGPCLFLLAREIYEDKRAAALAAVLFISNYWLYEYGAFYVADLGGYFFFVLSSLFAVKFYKAKNYKYYYLAILSSSAGAMFKEFGALAMPALIVLIAMADGGWKKKIRDMINAGLLFLIIPALYHVFIYFKYDFTYLTWYIFAAKTAGPGSSYNLYTFPLFLKVFGWVFFAGWPIFLYGLWQEKKFWNKERQKLLAALLPSSLSFFIWPMFIQRIAFVAVPWLSLVSGFGLSKIANKYLVVLIVTVYILLNYHTEALLKIINLPF